MRLCSDHRVEIAILRFATFKQVAVGFKFLVHDASFMLGPKDDNCYTKIAITRCACYLLCLEKRAQASTVFCLFSY